MGFPAPGEGTCFSGHSLGNGNLSPLAQSPPGSVHTCQEPRRSRDVCGLWSVRFQLGVRVQHEEEPLGGSSRGARPDMRPQLWGAASAGSRVREGQSSPGSAAGLLEGEASEQPHPTGLQGRWLGGALAGPGLLPAGQNTGAGCVPVVAQRHPRVLPDRLGESGRRWGHVESS